MMMMTWREFHERKNATLNGKHVNKDNDPVGTVGVCDVTRSVVLIESLLLSTAVIIEV